MNTHTYIFRILEVAVEFALLRGCVVEVGNKLQGPDMLPCVTERRSWGSWTDQERGRMLREISENGQEAKIQCFRPTNQSKRRHYNGCRSKRTCSVE